MTRFRTLLALLAAVLLASALSTASLAPANAVQERQAAARLTVSPATGVKSGQLVTVKGTGFTPGKLIYIVECANTSGQSYCGTNKIKNVKASSSGAFTTTYKVYTGAVGTAGKCRKGAKCLIVASDTVKSALGAFTFAR
jgi:hypothetical protein